MQSQFAPKEFREKYGFCPWRIPLFFTPIPIKEFHYFYPYP